ncbi:PAS domain-containing sensor histidine kinase [Desulfobacula sp.]|uniref:PAS domain-containing sensor histidine kinase n=1 Tax=Desulfobacula sp. TaxID=2593537 RepID=UPI00262E6942|nr:PAS domain-containing sensor histidine kinase [Desulfobacula sp.]
MKSNFFSLDYLFSSIRSKFIAIFVILGLMPLIIVGFFAYNSASNALLLQTSEQLGNLADKTAQQIDTFFEVVEKDIDLLSNFPFIQLSFLQYEFGQKLDTAKRLMEEYEQKNQYYKQIHLINLQGKSILTVPRDSNKKSGLFNTPDWFDTALEKDMFLSDIIMNESFADSFLILSKKVYDFEDKTKPVGILVFEIKLSSFTLFVSSLKIGTQGYSFLINDKGYLIYHPDQSLNLKNTFLENEDEKLAHIIKKMESGERGFGDYLFKKRKKYIVFTPCRIKNWSVGITLQHSEFMADIIKLRQSMMTFSALIITLIIFVSLLFVKSLTQPISQLITGARAIGAGDLDQTIRVESSDELQGLAREFNKMAARLKTSMQEIVELKTFNDDIFRSVSSGIITVNRKGELTSINKSAQKILSFSGRIGSKDQENIPAGIKKALALLMLTLGKKEKIGHQVLDFFDQQGEPVFIEINTSLLNESGGKVIGAIADIRDVTLRKRMEELMMRVDKLASLGELSAGIAHEIRNPLAGMKTSIQVLAKKLTDPSQLLLIEGVLSEIDRLNEIVTDLLKFSGPAPSFPIPMDIKIVLEKTLDLLMEKIKKLNIKIVQKYDHEIPSAFLDREQIQQVFLNLMLNAVNAMPGGGTLTISIKRIMDQERIKEKIAQSFDPGFSMENEYMAVSFTDTGSGIKEENLLKVFNPFFTTDPNGTGLGLSIAHKLLEKNNAYIYIDSKEGRGCRVTLIIPMADESRGTLSEPPLKKPSKKEVKT